jgi:glyoxylase-like metal-dependent hydrolase (beta-lactamase superfamily II)/rhodanese-related sulfurtransferase
VPYQYLKIRPLTKKQEKIMLFKQLFDEQTWTYTYLLADSVSKEAVIIDPVNTHIEHYMKLLAELGLTLKYSLETHVHADHITASGLLRQRTGAQTAVHSLCGATNADVQMQDGDIFAFGEHELIKVIATAGHTRGSVSFLWRDRVFTGDSLLIGGCGRTDFQGGDAGTLYDCITQRLFTLPDETLVYPGHDYQGRWVSSIMQERSTNPRLFNKTRAEFIDIMENLNLPKPRLIEQAVPANRYCGLDEKERQDAIAQRDISRPQRYEASSQILVDEAKQSISEVSVSIAKQLLTEGNINLLDVRELSEYNEGHIDNALLLPRGVLEFKINQLPQLSDKSKAVLVYCKTGGRSALAARTLQQLGYTNVLSIAGGFDSWQENI